ncbi:MAG: aminotransferase class I/II-fold pyridoxal phosphate-dependent enzyme [Armatimonadetes bacterium]|nr:aminotransferase class I/II-fold pyridoxal phosphate-dependent enzyme [Armatimonadota bacterium]
MQHPRLSRHIQARQPSAIRIASIKFAERSDGARAINLAIGNVSLPMHPSLARRMTGLGAPESPLRDGVVGYTATVGTDEARRAFLNVIESSGLSSEGLHCQITDGGSQAMELVIVALCGPAGSEEQPLLLIDAAYTNYNAFASRLGRATVSITRTLQENGKFTLPELSQIEEVIERSHPGALVVIPYDNPTGHFYDHETMVALARLCVKHNLWLISDEAYRELFYTGERTSSVWALTEDEVPGITGRRISIETASKVWNACGLRIGALVTDNGELHERCVAENTASLCSSTLGQHIFGALAHESHADLQRWYKEQRSYYQQMMESFGSEMKRLVPGIVVGSPDAAIYTVLDVRRIVPGNFDSLEFVLYCASEGALSMDGGRWTLLTAPMAGFYSTVAENPGRTQMRVAFVETPEQMQKAPALFAGLLESYLRASR